MDDLRINDRLTLPGSELEERFTTSGGPGGQHANRSASRVTLSFDIAASTALDDTQRRRVLARHRARLSDGVLSVTVDESRSQWRNRQLARARMADLIAEGLQPPAPPRRPTKPTRASQRKRIDDKKARGRLKRLRRRPDPE